PISDRVVLLAMVISAALFFLPVLLGGGGKIQHDTWNRAGLAAAVIYVACTWYTHHMALSRIQKFAELGRLQVDSIGALPLHPSPIAFAWALTATFCRKAGPRADSWTVYFRAANSGLAGGFAVRGMDDHLAVFADAGAFRAHPGHILQGHMHDAALARRHGIQAEGLVRSLHAFGGHRGGPEEFLKTQRGVGAAS